MHTSKRNTCTHIDEAGTHFYGPPRTEVRDHLSVSKCDEYAIKHSNCSEHKDDTRMMALVDSFLFSQKSGGMVPLGPQPKSSS